MTLQTTRFEAPESIEAAAALLAAEPDARVLAGGTDLLVQAKLSGQAPALYVDVKRIDRLRRITLDDAALVVGAGVPAAEIHADARIEALWPGLWEASDLIGSTQIQGRATWAGNLCNASPAADTVPALVAVGAEAIVAGPDGERSVPVDAFATGPGQTLLERGELVVEIRVPRPAPRTADAYLRLIPRTEMDIAVVGAGVSVTLDGEGRIAAARVALGAVAPTVLVVSEAAQALIGTTGDEAALAGAAEAARDAARPIDDRRGSVAYRKRIAGVLTRRAAQKALERATERA